jgi:arylsulfatase A-like enzyme
MKTIVIMSDTLRRDYLGCYGNTWVKTPVMDELARRSVVFDKAYAGSFPTVPVRADIMLGRHVFPTLGWEPLPPKVPTMAGLLGEAGYTSMMITDTPHMLQNGFHYDRGFTGWQWIRGQESDRVRTDYMEEETLPCSPEKLRQGDRMRRLHYLNTHFRRNERDTFVAQTMSAATDWIEANYKHENFLLYVDTFDPHEPWDAPEYYLKMYEKEYHGDNVDYPAYDKASRFTREEVAHCRALYAAEVTLVDTWIGELLRKVERVGIGEETAIILMSDHGFYFGEHDYIGKFSSAEPMPYYEEVNALVMIAHVPGAAYHHGTRSDALVQPADILPTVLDLAGVKAPAGIEGRSLLPMIRREGAGGNGRKLAVTSAKLIGPGAAPAWERGGYTSITDGTWTLMYGGEAQPSELYDMRKDRGQTRNLIDAHLPEAIRLHREYLEFLNSLGVKGELFQAKQTPPFARR